MTIRKAVSFFLVFLILLQNLIFAPTSVSAASDSDGSANIDLSLTPTIPSSSIIGQNFTLDVALQNQNTSDGDGYRPGIILNLPAGVSLVSAGTLGSPIRTVSHASGTTLVFFQTTNDVLLKGLTSHYSFTLTSNNSAGVFVPKKIGVLGYVDDNIYGRGPAPSGSPPGTLTGGIDYASGSGVSMADPTNLTFLVNVNSSTNLSTLPFITPTTQFTPFDVTKSESTANLIGGLVTTTLTVKGNSMGSLKHFHLQDVIPSNRAFAGFLSTTGATIGGLAVTYDAPTLGQATLDITDIAVPMNTDVTIQYQTLPLAYTIESYSGSSPVLDTGSVIAHDAVSVNTVSMHTGGLTLSGGPYSPTTWNNGTSDVLVNQSSILSPRSVSTHHRYANLAKSADRSTAVVGDLVTYTITLNTAKNAAFTTNGSGTYITDILPDGMDFSGALSSSLSGAGTPFTFISSNTDGNGDTTLLWRLNSGVIGADATATIRYQAVVDGLYEGAGDTEYENTETLVNNASFFGTVGDGGLSGTWGMTDPSIIDSTIAINNITATIQAPSPTTKKHLISVTTPSGTLYDWSTGLPSSIPPGSALRFAVTMDFPNVNFINPRLIDALPLLAGPNTSAYDFSFQTGTTLKDIYNTGVLFNTEDGVIPNSTFNGLSLIGTVIPNAPWISTTPANNLEFQLGTGSGKKTFALLFTVDILATKPSGGVGTTGLVPLTNFAYSSFNDDTATPNPLPIMEIPFNVNFPSVTAVKTASGGTNVEAGKQIDYIVTLTNSGTGPAYLENIADTLPVNMDLLTGSIIASGALTELSNSSITQSGNTLIIAFDTGSSTGGRSLIPLDTLGTLSVKENIIVIHYSVVPNTNFVIQGGASRTNTVTLDYYASSGAVANGVNNLGPVTTSANISVKSPAMSRSLLSTTEADSTTNNLYIGEQATYRTIITLPQGTFNLANYVETNNANLLFLTGIVVAYSGSLSLTGVTNFSGATVPFGTITNSDTDPSTLETIVLDTTYRVIKTATPGTNYTNNATLSYSSTSLVGPGVVVNVRKPTLTITKTPTPSTGMAGDMILYTVTVNNTSVNADAYDIRVTDLLPSSIFENTGNLTLGSYSGAESNLFSSSGSGNGLALDRLPPGSGATFTFQATVRNTVHPAENFVNRVDLAYDTLPADNSPDEWTGATFANASYTVNDVILSHTITSTTLADTTSALFSGALVDLAIGEGVTYRTDITVPQSTFTGFTITQTLPAGMKFLSGSILVDGIKLHTLTSISISPQNIVTFTLGDVDNTGIGSGSGMTLMTDAVVLDHTGNTAGGVNPSNLVVNYGSNTKSFIRNVEVVEPTLSVVKAYSITSGDAGDTLPTTVTVTNGGSMTAYDVVLTDLTPSQLTAGVGYSGTITIGTLNPGDSRVYTYNSTINSSVYPGDILTGTASILSTSYPGTPTEGERTYTASDTDFVTIVNPGSVILTRLSPQSETIGDIVHYQIQVPVSEGSTHTLDLTNTIPTGMAVLPSSVQISTNSGLSYSGTVTPNITPSSTGIVQGQSQILTYNFTNLVNTDTNNASTEYIMILYDAIVLDSSDTNNGNTIIHTASANYEGGLITKSASALPVTIVEPYLNMTVSNSYVRGYTVPYTFTLTNTGTSTAYDVDLSTLLPAGVTYTGTLTITNSGGAVNLGQSGNSFTIDALPVNTGNPLTFTINGQVQSGAINGTVYTLTGTVLYTSETGSYSPVLTNPLNTERSGIGGVDDYRVSARTTSFTLNLALLDEAIGVVDLNGGDGLIDDIFEYTITLTNTGTVALSGIPVTLDIPAGFTGFTMMSIPAGSIDLSTATGGVSTVGYLSVTGVSIPVGQSRTIVYRVTALHTLNPGTTIPTTATVGNSVEGALGGTPNVPVTINAPRFITTALETDVNGSTLLDTEAIHHTLTLSNTGTATGTTVAVQISWSSGALFTTGSLIFQTGTTVNTGTLIIDEISHTIHFTIPAFGPGAIETFLYDTRANGSVGTTIVTQISALSSESVSASGTSNILTIVAPTPSTGAGGGGGGGGSSSPGIPTPPVVSTPTLPPSTVTNPLPVPPTEPVKTKPPVIKSLPTDQSIMNLYRDYLAKLARLGTLNTEENTAGVLGITRPKVLPQTGKSILERVKMLVNAKLNLEAPIFSHGGKDVREDLSFWLTDVPEIDRDRDEYIVLPSNGMITPINAVPDATTDYSRLVSGREIEINKYLKSGVMLYPGTHNSGYGSIGNTVIFGHSSYFKSDSGRYKTHFQKIIELEAGEEIWIYQRQDDGTYRRYRYVTTASYDTKPTDVSVLDPGIGKNLTLFTCTPIGNITGRWIVKAKYIDEEKITLETTLYGTSLSSTEKSGVKEFIISLKGLSTSEKKEKILQKFEALSKEKKTPYTRYFLLQLAKNYGEMK